MIDPLFSEAWTHAPGGHKILGRTLHSLCALDLLALEAINSPFLLDGVDADVSDLLLAVWILSNPHSPDCSISNLELGEDGKQWVEEVAVSVDMVRDCTALGAYIRDYYSLPEMMRTIADRPISPLGCPWMLSTVVTICRELHVPLYAAWTMPIGQLLWYRCSIEEMDSEDSRVVGPELRSQMQHATHAEKKFVREPGESIEAFAARAGISIEDAEFFVGR